MARTRRPNRMEELIAAATRVFCANGYRRTQMADVAHALGVAPGTLYLYVEGKEALFDLVVRHGLDDPPKLPPPDWPVPTPPRGSTLKYLRTRLRAGGLWPALDAALSRRWANSARVEFESILRELFSLMHRNRWGLAVLSKSAQDWPELARFFYGRLRRRFLNKLRLYLQSRIAAGQFRPVVDPAAAAVFINESLMWSAVHRIGDLELATITDDQAKAIALDALVNAFVKE